MKLFTSKAVTVIIFTLLIGVGFFVLSKPVFAKDFTNMATSTEEGNLAGFIQYLGTGFSGLGAIGKVGMWQKGGLTPGASTWNIITCDNLAMAGDFSDCSNPANVDSGGLSHINDGVYDYIEIDVSGLNCNPAKFYYYEPYWTYNNKFTLGKTEGSADFRGIYGGGVIFSAIKTIYGSSEVVWPQDIVPDNPISEDQNNPTEIANQPVDFYGNYTSYASSSYDTIKLKIWNITTPNVVSTIYFPVDFTENSLQFYHIYSNKYGGPHTYGYEIYFYDKTSDIEDLQHIHGPYYFETTGATAGEPVATISNPVLDNIQTPGYDLELTFNYQTANMLPPVGTSPTYQTYASAKLFYGPTSEEGNTSTMRDITPAFGGVKDLGFNDVLNGASGIIDFGLMANGYYQARDVKIGWFNLVDGNYINYEATTTDSPVHEINEAFNETLPRLNPNGTPLKPAITNASTSIWDVDCSDYSLTSLFTASSLGAITCWFEKGVMGVAGFMIEPHDFPLYYFNQMYQPLLGLFPFSTVTSLFSSLSTNYTILANTGTSTASLSLPFGGKNITILTAGMFENILGSSTYNLIYNTETGIVYLICAFLTITIIF